MERIGSGVIYQGHVLEVLQGMEADTVDCVVTSPPYWGLRDYKIEPQVWDAMDGCEHEWGDNALPSTKLGSGGNTQGEYGGGIVDPGKAGGYNQGKPTGSQFCLRCGAWRGSLGLEPTPELFVKHIVDIFREVRRVLKPTGVCFVNLGDSYAQSQQGRSRNGTGGQIIRPYGEQKKEDCLLKMPPGLKPKDLCGIPWRVAFALQADGWWLRSDIIWNKCLGHSTRMYAKTQKGEMPMTLGEMARLKPETISLWTLHGWKQVKSITKQTVPGIEIGFRNGARISCTKEHRWITKDWGLKYAEFLEVGDVLANQKLPCPVMDAIPGVPIRVGYCVGAYIAEGSKLAQKEDGLQFALSVNDNEITDTLRWIANYYGGSISVHDYSKTRHVHLYGKLPCSAILMFVNGDGSKHKHLSTKAWQMPDSFLEQILSGYLKGDGHYREDSDQWILGFTRNDALADDLRTLCARIGKSIRLRRTWHKNQTGKFYGFRGNISYNPERRRTEDWEIISIQKSKSAVFYDVEIDEPHVFTLGNGLLTHNSNPMPESVTDRPTKSHEYIFLLTKSAKYFWNQEAVREPQTGNAHSRGTEKGNDKYQQARESYYGFKSPQLVLPSGRNCRSVWEFPTEPTPEAHFATFPQELVKRCILAGCPEKGTVCDIFLGSGTTGIVAENLYRKWVGIELNFEYIEIARKRLERKANVNQANFLK